VSLEGQQLFDFKEVCAKLSLGGTSVRKLIADGHLAPGHKIPGQRGVRWFAIDIQNFLDKLRRTPPEQSPPPRNSR
jgi:predicted DNA-binding transcriptional regulator AlpA